MITFTAPTIIGTFILKAAFLIACMIAAGLVISIDAAF
jgi:hypothetical protein